MSALATTDDIFFGQAGLDRTRLEAQLDGALHGADDGEVFLEYSQSEALSYDDGKLKSASFDTAQGFGLRSIADQRFGYAHAAALDHAAIDRAASTVRAVHAGHNGTVALPPPGTNQALYYAANPLAGTPFETKLDLLARIDAFCRAADPRVAQVMVSLTGNWQAVQIMRAGGHRVADLRPLVRLNIAVVMKQAGRSETGSCGRGGRYAYEALIADQNWQDMAREAIRSASVNLEAIPAPAGSMTVVLGPGWPGVMLHEAVGHGLEGDFNRKGTSAFSNLIGQRVAAPGVTVVDDGTLPDRRGSITIDDEGTPSRCTVMIEDGILKGYIQDRMNAKLAGFSPTGNGRRQDFAHNPMPRMTNTYMLAGQHDPREIIESVKRGIYAVNFGGGQVDIVSGKFVFSASEAYLIEDGKIGPAVKGATLIGNGFDAMAKITMIGNDLKLDDGIGTCGKDGQGVPVGVGQPTLRMDDMTVGGTV